MSWESVAVRTNEVLYAGWLGPGRRKGVQTGGRAGKAGARDEERTIAIGKVSGFVSCCLFAFLNCLSVVFDAIFEFAGQHPREPGFGGSS